MKDRAGETEKSTNTMISSELSDVCGGSRGSVDNGANDPADAEEVEESSTLSQIFTRTVPTYSSSRGVTENYFLFHSGSGQDKILIFGRRRCIDITILY